MQYLKLHRHFEFVNVIELGKKTLFNTFGIPSFLILGDNIRQWNFMHMRPLFEFRSRFSSPLLWCTQYTAQYSEHLFIGRLYFIYSKIQLSFMFDAVKVRMWSWFLVNIMFVLKHSAIVVDGSCKHKHTLDFDSISIRAVDLIGYSFCIIHKFINVYIFWDWNVNECNWYYYFMRKGFIKKIHVHTASNCCTNRFNKSTV